MDQRISVPTQHKNLRDWVDDVAALTNPDRIYWCDGSIEEYDRLCHLLIDNGTSYACRMPNVPIPSGPVRSGGRRAGRGADLHLLD